MDPLAALRTCLARSLRFSGRAPRPEFWWPLAVAALASATVSLTAALALPAQAPLIDNLFALAIFLPLVAAGTRRLHDTGRSGWPMGLAVLASALGKIVTGTPILGIAPPRAAVLTPPASTAAVAVAALPVLVTLRWLAAPGQTGPNAYGPDPMEMLP